MRTPLSTETGARHLARIRDRVPDLEAYAGVRAFTLSDGAERGVRMLHFRAGGGLEWEVVVDRGFDIGRISIAGQTLSWHSPTGHRAPWLLDPAGDEGQGFLRGHSGFMATCGLDHIRQPATVSTTQLPLHPSGRLQHPLHGGIWAQPARLIGYGCDEDRELPLLWCEAELRQVMVFGHCLSLRRRYECEVGSCRIGIGDRVKNIGPSPAAHLMLYHLNLGYPLIDDGTAFMLAPAEQLWQRGDGDPLAAFGAPIDAQVRQLSLHRWVDDRQAAQVTITAASGLAMQIETDPRQLPFCQLLRLPSKGHYGLSIEPCTAASFERADADRNGETRMLVPGEEVRYDLGITVTSPPSTNPQRSTDIASPA